MEEEEENIINEECCACEEAKYEVMFQGLWSKETHPRDFPTSAWLLHFSDVIGASHDISYRYRVSHYTNIWPTVSLCSTFKF